MARYLVALAALSLLAAPAYGFEDVAIGQWSVSQHVGGEMPVCEATTTEDGMSISLGVIGAQGSAILSVALTPDLANRFNSDNANVHMTFSTDAMQAKGFDGELVMEDHTGNFEASFDNRTEVIAALAPSSFMSLRLSGDQGMHNIDIENVPGVAVSKALSECIDDLETPEMATAAQAEMNKPKVPKQSEREFATFISLANKLGRIAEVCSRSGASFTQDEAIALGTKRAELEAAWKAPSENARSFIRQGQLEVDALLSSLTPSDCPKLRLYFDGYIPVVLKVNPDELVEVVN